MCLSPHARTRVVMWVVGPCASFASPAPGRTWIDRDAHARSTPRRPPRRCARRAAHARSARKAHHASSGRACCCGGGFLLLRFPDAGVPRAAARDSRGARAVWDVRARVEQRRELRVATGGWSACFCRLARRACCCVFFAFSTRPDGGKTTTAYPGDHAHPRHHDAFPRQTTRPWATSQPQPQGAWGRNRPNCVPMPPHLHTITSRHPLAPPARAARSRRPLAPPVRAARSRRPLAPSAHAAASLHRHQTLMGTQRALQRGHPQQTATAMPMLLSRPPWWVCGGDTDARHLPISASSINRKQSKTVGRPRNTSMPSHPSRTTGALTHFTLRSTHLRLSRLGTLYVVRLVSPQTPGRRHTGTYARNPVL